jgi:uncharacterized protein YndB with AHSA1/START domain
MAMAKVLNHPASEARRRAADMRVEESIEINRPLEEVFSYVSDVDNFPEWTGPTIDVRKDTAGPPGEGDEFTVAIKFLGRRFETPYERVSYRSSHRRPGL